MRKCVKVARLAFVAVICIASLSACSAATATIVLAAIAGAAQGYANSQQIETSSGPSPTGTAFLKSELVSGSTKQCVYDYLGSAVVRTVQSYQTCPVSVEFSLGNLSPSPSSSTQQPVRPVEITGFLKREIETGMTKQCFYDALGSTYSLTIKNYQLCPPSAKFAR